MLFMLLVVGFMTRVFWFSIFKFLIWLFVDFVDKTIGMEADGADDADDDDDDDDGDNPGTVDSIDVVINDKLCIFVFNRSDGVAFVASGFTILFSFNVIWSVKKIKYEMKIIFQPIGNMYVCLKVYIF